VQEELFTQAEQKMKLRNQKEAIVYFMAHLDIEMVSSFLEEDKTYQDFPKYIFISKLIAAFEKFEQAGDKVLSVHKGACGSCTKGCSGFSFLGKQGHYMDILFLMEGDEIKDIYECASFINDDEELNKLSSVDIDPTSFPFSDDDASF